MACTPLLATKLQKIKWGLESLLSKNDASDRGNAVDKSTVKKLTESIPIKCANIHNKKVFRQNICSLYDRKRIFYIPQAITFMLALESSQ